MKILLVSLEYPPQFGGVASYYANLKEYWPAADSLIVLDNSKDELLAKRRVFPWLRSIKAIYQSYQTNQSELALIGQVLPLGTSAAFLSIFKKFHYGIFFHGLDYSLAIASPFKKGLTAFILSRAKVIICANSEVRRLLINWRPKLESKIILLNPGAKSAALSPLTRKVLKKRHQLEGKKVILSLGRLVRRKGFDKVIQALDLIESQDFVYLICGQGEEKNYLRDLVAASKHRERIVFVDSFSEEEKWAYYSLCDIFIMPSRNIAGDFEGFGIVYLEANLMSRPVIAGASGGVADAVVDGLNGLLINPEDINEIAKALEKLLTNEDLARKLGEQGKERAEKDFNWQGLANKLANYLRKIC